MKPFQNQITHIDSCPSNLISKTKGENYTIKWNMNVKKLIRKSWIGKGLLGVRASIINRACDRKRKPLIAPLADVITSLGKSDKSLISTTPLIDKMGGVSN